MTHTTGMCPFPSNLGGTAGFFLKLRLNWAAGLNLNDESVAV